MRAFVFTDRALDGLAGRFVWLSIDTENERNAAFVGRYPIEAWPTLFVIDPHEERAVLRWIGGATVEQLEALLDDGERAMRGTGTGQDAALVEADLLLARGLDVEAAEAYARVIETAPPGWSGRNRAVESRLGALALARESEKCVEAARAELGAEPSLHLALVATLGLDCALGLDGSARAQAVAEFEAAARSVLGEPRAELPADDRSSIYGALAGARQAEGDETGAKQVAADWLAFLEAEAARAPDPRARTVFDSHRLAAALALGEPARAIAPLEQSERDFPDDYNPPARLALAYGEAGRLDDALAAAGRALERVYGPRKLRVWDVQADLLIEKGDRDGARAALEQALAHAKSLPAELVPARRVTALEERLRAMGEAAE